MVKTELIAYFNDVLKSFNMRAEWSQPFSLSRLDLLFVGVLDQLDPDTDRRIAAHMIQGHMYKGGNAKW